MVLPEATTSATASNYTILAAETQTSVQYVNQALSRTYTYVTGDKVHVLLDARDVHGNLRYTSTGETFAVTLTGSDLGTTVTGNAVALTNGSYSIELPVTIAEPYDLAITLVVASVGGGPASAA